MCKWGTEALATVKIPAHLSYTGEERWAVKPVDSCIVTIVRALQAAGIETLGSCCGHGKEDGSILLADGRTLIIRQ